MSLTLVLDDQFRLQLLVMPVSAVKFLTSYSKRPKSLVSEVENDMVAKAKLNVI